MNGQTFIDALRTLEDQENVAPMARLYGPDATIWSPQVDARELPKRPDGAERFWREYRAAFQHVRSEFLSVTDAGSRSVLEWESSGSMRDGSPFTYRGVSVVEWNGDRIQRFATYFDPSALPAVPQRTESAEGQSAEGQTAGDPSGNEQARQVEGASYTSPRRAA